ncbi:MAG: Glu-tRNA(Gln) amidotransferase subunit GatE [Candidatus Aminicenantes bacterium]|jgi:glutamyl-tRNA(Gln) amidotransferase subunit E
MKKSFDPLLNYRNTKKAIGYIPIKDTTQADYDRIGFMAGLEVHQQLKTQKKLFCNCPAGVYNTFDDFDAEIIRHMRPTLSELGEYDGTALMEFKTRKTIIYRIKNETACTYDIDDTPPFPINREAVDIALEISLLCKLNIVGEIHIIRKQYLDGSIPTGFQRTAILGVEGEIPLKHKKIRLIQLSVEEDSCREVSDVGHVRTYQTDRLGIPLIETVTYPDFANPDEVREGAEYIRFLNRSTGKVFTGIGAGREDVNCSCRGGSRVEIKGVSHNKWIPELTHNEVFRQWALLHIRDLLNKRVKNGKNWKIRSTNMGYEDVDVDYTPLAQARENHSTLVGVNLPGFKGILSHFTQPGKIFADEISDRIKVVACIGRPHLIHTEAIKDSLPDCMLAKLAKIKDVLKGSDDDAQMLIWGPAEDIPTALESIEERCQLAFEGVPRESRKSFENGTTIFERVLPGPDRMYPDTDSAPIPVEEDTIRKIEKNLPIDVSIRLEQLQNWGAPQETFPYILKTNLMPVIELTVRDLEINPKMICSLFGHTLKHWEGQYLRSQDFAYDQIYELLEFLQDRDLDFELAKKMIPVVYQYPNMDYDSVLTTIKFKRISKKDILDKVPFLMHKFEDIKTSNNEQAKVRWIMGELRGSALGNVPLAELKKDIEKMNKSHTKHIEGTDD